MRKIWNRSLIIAPLVFAGALLGCVAPERKQDPGEQPTQHSGSAADALATQDAERAKAAIEREHALQSGQRRPSRPVDRPPVDQPRVGGGVR